MPSPLRAGQHSTSILGAVAWLTVIATVLCFAGTAFAQAQAPAIDPSGVTVKVGQPQRSVPALAQSHEKRGEELALTGDVDGAISELREAIRIDPDFVLARANLGHALRRKGRIDEAIEQFRAAAVLEPGYVPAHYNLGVALTQKGDLETAIAHLHIARQLEPENAEVRIALSAALLKWQDVKGAITQAREAVQISPDNPAAHYQLGLALTEAGMLADAVTEYETAAKGDDKNDKIQVSLGAAYAGKGDLDQAIVAYRKAVELKPTSACAQNDLGAALLDAGKPDEAIAALQTATSLEPSNVMFSRNLASALRKKGDADQSIASYHDSLRLDPKDASLHEGIALTLLERSDLDAAIDQFASLMKSDPTNADVEKALATIVGHFVWGEHLRVLDTMRPEAYVLPPRIAIKGDPLGEVEAQVRQFTPALMLRGCQAGARMAFIATLKDTMALQPVVMGFNCGVDKRLNVVTSGTQIVRPASLPDYVLRPLLRAGKVSPDAPNDLTPEMRKTVCAVAIALQHFDDLTEAIGEFQVAVKMNPDCAARHNNLGRALLEAARTTEALAEFKTAIALTPDLGEAHFNAGIALGMLGRMPEAVAEWKAACAVGLNSAPLNNYLGIAALESTEFSLARSYFEKAARLDGSFAPAKYNLAMLSTLEKTSLPLAEKALEKSRDATPFGSKHYDLRGEFILDEKLAPSLDALVEAGTADQDLKGLYHYVGVELCLQPADAAPGISGVAIVHDTSLGTGLSPDCLSVHNNLGVAMAAKGDLKGAEAMLTAATAESPSYALAHWNLGQVLLRDGKANEGNAEIALAARLAKTQRLPYILPFKSGAMRPISVAAAPSAAAPAGFETATRRGGARRGHRRPGQVGQAGDVELKTGPCQKPCWEPKSILDAFHSAYTH